MSPRDWKRCLECGLTHGKHSPNCPADAWHRNRLEAEAAFYGAMTPEPSPDLRNPLAIGADSPLYQYVRRVQDAATLPRQDTMTPRPHDATAAKPHDAINPAHYRAHPSGVECIAITEHMGFNLGNAVKYIWRADLKHTTPLDDLKKARWYLDREIAKLGGGNAG